MAAAPGLGSQLCTKCGLCCMGVIHNNAVLDTDEVAGARALGLTVIEDDRPLFSLPCPHLAGTVCSIYANRPRVCGRYRCNLLRGVEADAGTFDGALEHIAKAKAIVAEIRSLMPDGVTLKEARKLLRTSDPEPGWLARMERSTALRMRLAVTALHLYLDKYFRHEDEYRAIEMQAVPPQVEHEG